MSGTAQAADPPAPGAPTGPLPTTVTSDALPTWQINGVVWSQAIVGDTVYVAGSFTRARPPGVAAGGAGEVVANNAFAYSLSTGNRVAAFNHSLNAQSLVVRASADGSRVYYGGDFTTVDGTARGHIAAFDTATGNLVAGFAPNVGGQVRGLGITTSSVYVGGNFTSANGIARTRLAAFQPSNGAMTSWAPAAAGGYVWAMALSPDKTKVFPGGSFTTVNGQPAYGMASINADGTLNPVPAQEKIRAAGANGAITSLKSDGTQIYGTTYAFGAGASFEGVFALNPDNGQINWANDCLGDTYDVAAVGEVVYNVSHQHDCTVVGGWNDTNPRSRWQKASANTTYATNITTKNDVYGWNFVGVPYAAGLHWYPNFAFGSYTSSGQAGWSVEGNSNYLVVGGEFPRVNGAAQQGLVRFANSAIAPKKVGPSYSTVPATPVPATTATAWGNDGVRVTFGAGWDMDDKTLKYEVLRNNNTWLPAKMQEADSNFWTLPRLGFVDTGLTPGSSNRYQVRISDPDGNIMWSPVSNTVTVGGIALSNYANDVLDSQPDHYWRLGESGASGVDYAAFDDVSFSGGYTRGAPGAISGDADAATSFGGSDGLAVNSTPIEGPNVFSLETWFRTTSTTGGKIVGFGDQKSGTSNNYDRHVYMSPDGKVWFGVYNNGLYTVNTSAALNDGAWHHVVGSLSPAGVTMYVDGLKIGTNASTTEAQPYTGYWRIGGDTNWNGAAYFNGDIDDVAIYSKALSRDEIQDHFRDSGRTLDVPVRPADAYGQAVWDSAPDLYYRLGETTGTVAKDSSPNRSDGTYTGGYTRGQAGAVPGTNTSTAFNGIDGGVFSNQQFSNPQNYSLETWFKTTSTDGGKLLGFGCAQQGGSGCYDRHIYLTNDGKLTFGVWTGFTNTITTSGPVNDGHWHHVVASQSNTEGMKMYLDGVLVGTNGQTDAQDYAGYWRIGGDNHWGCCSPYFAGQLDEVAVYSSVLSPTVVTAHYQAGGGTVPNQNPVAAFTSTVSDLAVSVTGAGSTDPDGTVASYAWAFGDGGTASGATASHTYAAAGTFSVTLTVTDNDGAANAVTHPVTVAAPAELARDAFGRTTANGWGSADVGGSWTVGGPAARWSVSGGTGQVSLNVGNGYTAFLPSASSTTMEAFAKFTSDKAPTGGGQYVSLIGRRVSATDDYRAKVRFGANGAVAVWLARMQSGTETILTSVTVPGLTFGPGDQIQVREQVSGTSPTTVRVKVWKVGSPEPAAWLLSGTDAAPDLQVAGTVGVYPYLSSTTTNGPVIFGIDDFWAGALRP